MKKVESITRWLNHKEIPKDNKTYEDTCYHCGKTFNGSDATWLALLDGGGTALLCRDCAEKQEAEYIKEERKGKEEKDFEIWSGWYQATGEMAEATYHGTFKGRDFAEACDRWAETLSKESKEYYHPAKFRGDKPSYYSTLFDNQDDANRGYPGVVHNTKEKRVLKKIKEYVESTEKIDRDVILGFLK